MKAYSMDLRERIVAALNEGERVVSVAARYGVCERTVRAYRARAHAGKLAPSPIPGSVPRVSPAQEDEFMAMVQESPNATIAVLQQEWQRRSGVLLPSSTLHDHLKRLGGRYKKRAASPVSATKRSAPASASR